MQGENNAPWISEKWLATTRKKNCITTCHTVCRRRGCCWHYNLLTKFAKRHPLMQLGVAPIRSLSEGIIAPARAEIFSPCSSGISHTYRLLADVPLRLTHFWQPSAKIPCREIVGNVIKMQALKLSPEDRFHRAEERNLKWFRATVDNEHDLMQNWYRFQINTPISIRCGLDVSVGKGNAVNLKHLNSSIFV